MSIHVPAGWTWASFADVADIASNLVDPTDWKALPHIAPNNIERDTGKLLAYRTIAEDGVTSVKHRFYPGQLLYSKIRPYLNKCVRVDFEGLCSADMYPVEVSIGTRFLHHYMLTRLFVSAVSEAAGSRTVLPKTNQKQMAGVPVPVAPLNEQRRIVEAIESYFTRLDDAVATLERVQRNLERYRASILKAAVEGRLVPTEAELARAEGRDYEPASVLLERILSERRRRWEETELEKMRAKGKTPKDDKWKATYKEPVAPDTSGLPELPPGWCWARAEQCVNSQVGHAFKSTDFIDNGVRLLRGDNIGHGVLRWEKARRKCISANTLSEYPHLCLRVDDIILAMDRPVISTGLKLARVRPADLPALLVQRVARLRPTIHRKYFELNLYSQRFVQHLIGEARGGGVPHVSEGQIKDFVFPLPPLAEQARISLELERILSNVTESSAIVEASVRHCSRLRQSILKWAFEGRLVDQDPTDEPASLLLERIQAERESSDGDPRRSTRRPTARSSRA